VLVGFEADCALDSQIQSSSSQAERLWRSVFAPIALGGFACASLKWKDRQTEQKTCPQKSHGSR